MARDPCEIGAKGKYKFDLFLKFFSTKVNSSVRNPQIFLFVNLISLYIYGNKVVVRNLRDRLTKFHCMVQLHLVKPNAPSGNDHLPRSLVQH